MWAKKVVGSLQMDLTYSTIPVFGGEHRRLYREFISAYIISDHQNPSTHPICAIEDEIRSSVFHLNNEEPEITVNKCKNQCLTDQQNKVWKMYFYGSSSKEGYGDSIVLISLADENITLSYKMEFDTTNNIDEYEALVLGLRASIDMAIESL
jgi:hypothetical protein